MQATPERRPAKVLAALPWHRGLSAAAADADSGRMWLWIAGVWCSVAVLAAVLHHRLRSTGRRRELREFQLALTRELQRHPGVELLGMLPRSLTCVLRVDGQETPVALADVFRRSQAFAGTLGKMVDQLVAEIRDVGLDRVLDHEWGYVATALLPQIKTDEWVRQQGHFGDGALVHRPLIDNLQIVYVIDDPHAMVFVCRAHLRQWRRNAEDVHRLAIANLNRRAGLLPQVAAEGDPTLLQSGDGYDAARVLLLDRADGLLVAMPDRDVLWLARDEGQSVETLAVAAGAMARVAPHPISDRVYRLKGGRLETVSS